MPKTLEILILLPGMLRVYAMGPINATLMRMTMEVDKTKIVNDDYAERQLELPYSSFSTDYMFRSLLVLQTSQSSMFIIQKERSDNSTYLWHVTSFIESPASCPTILKFFVISDADSHIKDKVVLIC